MRDRGYVQGHEPEDDEGAGGSGEGGLAETTTGVAQRVCAEEVVAAADTEGVTQRWEGCTGG